MKHLLFSFEGNLKEKAGVNGNEDPPVPIPNTEVKLIRVENTWLETTREDRSMPAQNPESSLWVFLISLFEKCLDFSLAM